MTDNVVRADFKNKRIQTDEYFGGCPLCGKTSGYIDLDHDHWFVCDAHQTRWHVKSNLLPFLDYAVSFEETLAGELVRSYRTVQPIYAAPEAPSADLP